jgi:hypothetical protein
MPCKCLFASLLFTVSVSAVAQQPAAPTSEPAILPNHGQDQTRGGALSAHCAERQRQATCTDPSRHTLLSCR